MISLSINSFVMLKSRLLLIFAFVTVFPVWGRIIRPQENIIANIISKSILTNKCQLYLAGDKDICHEVSSSFLRFVDISYETTEKGREEASIVFLRSENLRLLKDKRFPDYIRGLLHGLSQIETGLRRSFDLFRFTQTFLGSEEEAITWIGILFQDNNFNYHEQWLRSQISDQSLLNDYLQIYKMISANKVSKLNQIKIYPPDVGSNEKFFSRKIYYYYLPRIIQRRLTQNLPETSSFRDSEKRRIARAYSLFITFLYMNHHFWGGTIEGLLNNPVAVHHTSAKWESRYRDLYMATLGSLSGGQEIDLDYEFFVDAFMANPMASLQNLSFQISR